jgi:hypothetical protein
MKVTSIMLLKTHGEKMSETGLSIIYLKTKHIKVALYYIYENKMFVEIAERLGTGSNMDDRRVSEYWAIQALVSICTKLATQ